jgi:hypothetical protein
MDSPGISIFATSSKAYSHLSEFSDLIYAETIICLLLFMIVNLRELFAFATLLLINADATIKVINNNLFFS